MIVWLQLGDRGSKYIFMFSKFKQSREKIYAINDWGALVENEAEIINAFQSFNCEFFTSKGDNQNVSKARDLVSKVIPCKVDYKDVRGRLSYEEWKSFRLW